MQTLTGHDELVAEVKGGGMHQSGPGARLAVHVDFNRHPREPLQRLVNLIVYLNPDWTEEDGSALELWSETERVQTVVPVFNRCVIFAATDRSFHGHPVPVARGLRRSIALYYYGRGAGELPEEHSTIWLDAP
jgi:Rps23 Pro-64 3,4-dihydroxylase Tpa1-like proline 4-hydroxylase